MKTVAMPHFKADTGPIDLYFEHYSQEDRLQLINDLLDGDDVIVPRLYKDGEILDYAILNEESLGILISSIEKMLILYEDAPDGSGELKYDHDQRRAYESKLSEVMAGLKTASYPPDAWITPDGEFIEISDGDHIKWAINNVFNGRKPSGSIYVKMLDKGYARVMGYNFDISENTPKATFDTAMRLVKDFVNMEETVLIHCAGYSKEFTVSNKLDYANAYREVSNYLGFNMASVKLAYSEGLEEAWVYPDGNISVLDEEFHSHYAIEQGLLDANEIPEDVKEDDARVNTLVCNKGFARIGAGGMSFTHAVTKQAFDAGMNYLKDSDFPRELYVELLDTTNVWDSVQIYNVMEWGRAKKKFYKVLGFITASVKTASVQVSGWLSPEGEFFDIGSWNHDEWMKENFFSEDDYEMRNAIDSPLMLKAYDMGWVRLRREGEELNVSFGTNITQEAFARLFDEIKDAVWEDRIVIAECFDKSGKVAWEYEINNRLEYGKALREISSKLGFVMQTASANLPKDKDSKAWKHFVFTTDEGLDVYTVDGDYVRNYVETDFSLGGHGLVYPNIPIGEVWIEDTGNQQDDNANLLHELTEYALMLKGVGYEEAHTQALAIEMKYREKTASDDFGEDLPSLEDNLHPENDIRRKQVNDVDDELAIAYSKQFIQYLKDKEAKPADYSKEYLLWSKTKGKGGLNKKWDSLIKKHLTEDGIII